jgi:hypothetical protein
VACGVVACVAACRHLRVVIEHLLDALPNRMHLMESERRAARHRVRASTHALEGNVEERRGEGSVDGIMCAVGPGSAADGDEPAACNATCQQHTPATHATRSREQHTPYLSQHRHASSTRQQTRHISASEVV